MAQVGKTFWLHRISHHGEIARPLLEQGFLSIGFSDFRIENFNLLKSSDEKNHKTVFSEIFLNVWGEQTRARYDLWRFVVEMKKGDVVLVPGYKTFSVCEILEDEPIYVAEISLTAFEKLNTFSFGKRKDGRLFIKKQNSEPPVDLGYFRKIKLLEHNISREDYANAKLTRRLKYQGTNANVSDLAEDIEKARRLFRERRPLNIHSNLKEEVAPTILKTLKRDLDEKKFEKLIKQYFESLGATAFIPRKNEKPEEEGDADIIATFEKIKTIVYVQAKFHDGETDDWAVSQISGYSLKQVMDDEYSKIKWVISSGDDFSEKAKSMARQNHIQLINGKQFSEMLLDVGIFGLSSSEESVLNRHVR